MKEHRKRNVGASNYAQHSIQPWDVWKVYNLNGWDADIVKRILRTKEVLGQDPNFTRREDYRKIIHICEERISHLEDAGIREENDLISQINILKEELAKCRELPNG